MAERTEAVVRGFDAVSADWQKRVAAIRPDILNPKDHGRAVRTLMGVMSGESWAAIAADGFSLAEYAYLRRVSSVFKKLSDEAQTVADEMRQAEREEAAHVRAVKGAEIPVYTIKGELAGTYFKPSDDLLKFMMKASNPAKYGDKGGISPGSVVLQLNLGIPPRVQKEKPVYGDAKIIECEGAERLPAAVAAGSGSGGGKAPATAAAPEAGDSGRDGGAGGRGEGGGGEPESERAGAAGSSGPGAEAPVPAGSGAAGAADVRI